MLDWIGLCQECFRDGKVGRGTDTFAFAILLAELFMNAQKHAWESVIPEEMCTPVDIQAVCIGLNCVVVLCWIGLDWNRTRVGFCSLHSLSF